MRWKDEGIEEMRKIGANVWIGMMRDMTECGRLVKEAKRNGKL